MRTHVACLLILAVGLWSAPAAQTPMPGHVMEMMDEVPPETLPPPQKLKGVGTLHVPISATRAAQEWFDQGLNLIHDFWEYESARAFQQSIRVDPQCAMCYWGLFKAEAFYHSTSPGYARQALDKALALQDRVSERERLYIRATAADFPASTALWRELVQKYPTDSYARLMLAGEIQDGFDDRGDPRPGMKESLAMLEKLMKDEPKNAAAHHAYVHALEVVHPERALKSAELLGRLAPASGHIVHMPGHIFFRVGDYERAEKAFEASLKVDERYMREQSIQADQNWNYVHNLMYSIANLLEQGKLDQATTLSDKISGARGVLETTLYIQSVRDSISRIHPHLPVALRTGRWTEVMSLVAESTATPGQPNLQFLADQLTAFAWGMKAIDNGDLPAAASSSERLDTRLREMAAPASAAGRGPATTRDPAPAGPPRQRVMSDASLPPILRTLSIMALELRGSLAAAETKRDEAKAIFAQAAKAEKDLGYREPPHYIRPVRETEGAAMIAIGDWAAARAAFDQALVDRPRSGFALYGRALSSEKAGNIGAARKEYEEFLSAWKDADWGLPPIIHARAYLRDQR